MHHDLTDLAALLHEHGHRLLAASQTDKNVVHLKRKVLRVMPGQLAAVANVADVRRASHGRPFGLKQFRAHAADFARQFRRRCGGSGHLNFQRLDLHRRLADSRKLTVKRIQITHRIKRRLVGRLHGLGHAMLAGNHRINSAASIASGRRKPLKIAFGGLGACAVYCDPKPCKFGH